jgi:hypothetical protein
MKLTRVVCLALASGSDGILSYVSGLWVLPDQFELVSLWTVCLPFIRRRDRATQIERPCGSDVSQFFVRRQSFSEIFGRFVREAMVRFLF